MSYLLSARCPLNLSRTNPWRRSESTALHFYQNKQLELYASKDPKPMTLRQLVFYGRSMNEDRLLKSANYVRTELPVRIAHRLRDIQKLPYVVVTQEGVAKVYELYWSAFEKFRKYPPITTLKENEAFCDFLAAILDEHATVIPNLWLGTALSSAHLAPDDLDAFMRKMLVSRISRRVLAQHHIALSDTFAGKPEPSKASESNVGIITTSLNVKASIEKCANLLRHRPLEVEGTADVPAEVEIEGDVDMRFSYIREHLEYIVFELLKNSIRATRFKHRGSRELPVMRATIAAGDNAIVLIMLVGGGLLTLQDQVKHPSDLFSFSHTRNSSRMENSRLGSLRTASSYGRGIWATVNEQVENGHMPMGIGLPMSNIFATYFGGSLELVSLDGHGTDAYVRLPKLGTNLETLPLYYLCITYVGLLKKHVTETYSITPAAVIFTTPTTPLYILHSHNMTEQAGEAVPPAQRSSWASFLKTVASFSGDLSSMTAISLTEFPAYWCERPELFSAIADQTTEEGRALAVLKWFISTLKGQYTSRNESMGSEKKPLNPVLGELFYGKWPDINGRGETELLVEQVSHHPPITAYAIENKSKGVKLVGHNAQKTSFSGGNIIVKQIGHATLTVKLPSGDFAEYLITLPRLRIEGLWYGAPYIELADVSWIISKHHVCSIEYKGKGYFSGKSHSFKASLNPAPGTGGASVSHVIEGTWHTTSKISSGSKSGLDFHDVTGPKEEVTAIGGLLSGDMGEFESRELWKLVAQGIREGDFEAASREKTKIEARILYFPIFLPPISHRAHRTSSDRDARRRLRQALVGRSNILFMKVQTPPNGPDERLGKLGKITPATEDMYVFKENWPPVKSD
ncbi:hypothetical protein D9757_004918 [Collybiopsis confluens]|uniref:Protein-serine/threonine kinase n=1 Tax=Collybiopsis confluens TaxID=2823264 RepID=A0A8H5HT73_9AGAR|nr:hypothetical protein D9757_004918 [Collybiopsis confluens]